MSTYQASICNEDRVVSLLKEEISILNKILDQIESGRVIPDYFVETLFGVERNLKTLRSDLIFKKI